jgi:hypothetical protein
MSGIPFKPEGKLEGAYAPSIIIIYPLPLKKEGGEGDGFLKLTSFEFKTIIH